MNRRQQHLWDPPKTVFPMTRGNPFGASPSPVCLYKFYSSKMATRTPDESWRQGGRNDRPGPACRTAPGGGADTFLNGIEEEDIRMGGTGYMVSPNRQEPWVYGNGASCTSRLIPTCSGYKASDMAKDRLPAETRRSMRATGFLWPDHRPKRVPELSTLESKKNTDGRMEVFCMTPSVQKNRGYPGMVPPAPPDGPHMQRIQS
ncbi:MAG: hypothetical protein HOI65_05350 [Opitutae bacterium]|nr:hypothetical protein [Opitutae bacterium]